MYTHQYIMLLYINFLFDKNKVLNIYIMRLNRNDEKGIEINSGSEQNY